MATPANKPPGSSPYGATLTYLQHLFGYLIREQESFPAINVTAVQILPTNGDRLAFVVANTSTQNVTIGLTPAVSLTNGIQLNTQTGVVSVVVKDDLTLASHEWWAIAPGGPQGIYVLEVIAIRPLPPGT